VPWLCLDPGGRKRPWAALSVGRAPSITGVPTGLAPRTSHRRGPARTPQRRMGSTSCHHTAPHRRSLAGGKAGLAAGRGVPPFPPKRQPSPSQQGTCGTAHVGLVSPEKAKGLGGDKAAHASSRHSYLCGAKHLRRRLLSSQSSSAHQGKKKELTMEEKSNSHTHTCTPNSP